MWCSVGEGFTQIFFRKLVNSFPWELDDLDSKEVTGGDSGKSEPTYSSERYYPLPREA